LSTAKAVLAGLLCSLAASAAAAPLPASTRAPAFSRPDLNGRTVSLPAFRGGLVLVDFWATWCAPCVVELPHLTALQARYRGKLQIIGISMDDDAASPKQLAAQYRLNYPVVMGDAALGRLYGGVLGLPQIYLIGRDGKLLRSWRGEFQPAELDTAIEADLRQGISKP
jgi:thiol-disulfide isomerase/thioredoxin